MGIPVLKVLHSWRKSCLSSLRLNLIVAILSFACFRVFIYCCLFFISHGAKKVHVCVPIYHKCIKEQSPSCSNNYCFQHIDIDICGKHWQVSVSNFVAFTLILMSFLFLCRVHWHIFSTRIFLFHCVDRCCIPYIPIKLTKTNAVWQLS